MSEPTTADEPAPDEAALDEAVTAHGCPLTEHHGQTVLYPTAEQYLDVVKALADDGYHMCVDLTAVDHLRNPHRTLPAGINPERFEVVVNLLDITGRRRIRLRVQVPANDPVLPSLFDLYPGTEAMEREVFDMFGVTFTDHPDLTRILMPEDWDGHPLRKDYGTGDIPVQFKGTPN